MKVKRIKSTEEKIAEVASTETEAIEEKTIIEGNTAEENTAGKKMPEKDSEEKALEVEKDPKSGDVKTESMEKRHEEEKPVGRKSEEKKLEEEKPVKEKPEEEKPVKKPEEGKLVKERPVEKQPEEEKPVKEKPIEENTQKEKELTENATAGEKTVELASIENAAAEKNDIKEKAGGNVIEENPPDSESTENGAKKKKGRAKVVILAVALLAGVLAGTGYFGMASFYRVHFLPNTVINGEPCGNLKVEEVAPFVDAQLEDYVLTVTGRDYATGRSGALLGEIRAEDVALAYIDTMGAVGEVLAQQNAFLWFRAYLGSAEYSYSIVQGVTFDEELLRSAVGGWDACQKKNMILPEDAYISEYQEERKGFEVIGETPGTALKLEEALQYLGDSLYMHADALDLEEMQCYVEAARKSTDRELIETMETANSWLGTEITYDWNGNEVVLDVETLKDWVTVDQGELLLDEEAVKKFIKAQAREYDTYGKRKTFVTALGVTLQLRSPNYGWKTDVEAETEELIRLIRQGSQEKREPIYSVKASQKGTRDVGTSYVEADLTHQHLYVYEKGEVVFETDFVSGKMNSTPGCVTPEGIYGLSYKTTNAVLRGADYESPVSYWMPFFGNYGMHDASWRSDFGGTIYMEHGSHGCINLPVSSAAVIYEYVYTGSPVVCYYYEVDPLEAQAENRTLTEEELLSQEEPTLGQRQAEEQAQQTGDA